jgi:methyltransferase (TIGR00027 family)
MTITAAATETVTPELVEPSVTAKITAIGRWTHRITSPHPWVLDDPLGVLFVGPSWVELHAAISRMIAPEVYREAAASLLVRARFAEDLAVDGGFRQYVILGAGLDTFAWRRPDVLARTRCFEVDHPATQAWKVATAERLGLGVGADHVFAAIDFERDDLRGCLEAAGLDWSAPTLFSWLGVTMYLSGDAIAATLRTLSTAGGGSEVVFSYAPSAECLDDSGRAFVDAFSAMAAASGEPIRTLLPPREVEALVTRCGLGVVQHPTRDDLADAYLSADPNGTRPSTAERVIRARVL